MKNNIINLEAVSLGELSEFKHRNVEFYRSSDPKNTAIYWTNVDGEEGRKNASARFELLRFGYKGGDQQIYIKFPGQEFFIEMSGGGSGSGRGNMQTSAGINPWQQHEWNKKFEVISQEPHLLLRIGDEFNFMELAARIIQPGEEFLCRDSSSPVCFNIDIIHKALQEKYIKLPMHVRKIQYAYKTRESEPTYFVVDYPVYNFQYNLHRFRAIKNNNVEEMKVDNFERYRDGGTTYIHVTDKDGNKNIFYSPTPFEDTKSATWNEAVELEEVTSSEMVYLVHLLKMDLLPEIKKEE